MWVLVMFDLPTDTAAARRAYRAFRNSLLDDGFLLLQYSVYARHCSSHENAEVHEKRVKRSLPPDGEVRLLIFTDKQFSRMKVFYGKIRKATEKAPEQITLL